MQELSKLLSS